MICFDVRGARRLRKIADALENFGVRVQRSVFECHLETAQLDELQQRINDQMDAPKIMYAITHYAPRIAEILSSTGPARSAATPIIAFFRRVIGE